jgi:CHASE2 domain-containing sensor protein
MAPEGTRNRRPPLLVLLQTAATVLMSLAIGQAGLAAAFMTGHRSLKQVHEVNGFLLVAVTVATLVAAVLYQRSGGPRWPVAATVLLIVVEALQITLGEVEAAGAHIFLGVLFVAAATLLTSYLFRPGFSTSRERV